jgi:branched-chain amino acid transport system ATP-binding protein
VIELETRALDKSFGPLAVTQQVSLAFEQGQRYAIIGPNGAGKTTYFNLLAGNLRPDSGAILLGDLIAGSRRGAFRNYYIRFINYTLKHII